MRKSGYTTILQQRRVTEMHRFSVFITTFLILSGLIFFRSQDSVTLSVGLICLTLHATAFWVVGLPKTVI